MSILKNQIYKFNTETLRHGEKIGEETLKTVILLGHGSQNPEAHREFSLVLEQVRRLLPEYLVFLAYLQLREPDLNSLIKDLTAEGVREVIIIPIFLFAGNHILEDIPKLLKEAEERFPDFSLKIGRHLGPDPSIAKLIKERIQEVTYKEEYLTDPQAIEAKSFQIIEQLLTGIKLPWPAAEREIIKRVIHTTADPEIAGLLDFHPQAVTAGIQSLKNGVGIITDVKMSLIGIGNKATSSFGCRVKCYIDDPEVAVLAKETAKTRAIAGIIKACTGMKHGIVVVGNAPTALFQLCEMIERGIAAPDLIIGTPVGFVGAAESKEVLKGIGIPYIRTVGPRGGSTIAAAIVNALIKLAEPKQ